MKTKRVVLVGAGLAGISTAYHLRSDPQIQCTLLEKESMIGGTARSISIGGFTFDFTGHLLHLHDPYTKELIQNLLQDNLIPCVRKAAICSHAVLTPYPFQVNLYGLPDKIKLECVQGFLNAVKKYQDPQMRSTNLPFQDWSLRTFGSGIHKYFMKPYNEKLWQTSLDCITARWCGMFVPQPKPEDVIRGAQGLFSESLGYNAKFLYPKKGGIQVLAETLAKGIPIQLNTGLKQILTKEKKILLSTGQWISYNTLVSSIPLVDLLKKMQDLPLEIKNLIPHLKWNSVINFNLGIRRPNISDKSWIYFPEKKYIFYRVGFPMNFTPHSVPIGCSSMYVEISVLPDKSWNSDSQDLYSRVLTDLKKCNLLKDSDEIVVKNTIPIRYGYVHYTHDRESVLKTIFLFFEKQNIFSIGRYGEWKYSFMEEAILDGKKTAERILQSS